MKQEESDKRQIKAETELFVISRTEEGFRIYNPTVPIKSYIVSGSPEAPACTCPDFQFHEGDPQWRCKHILAVLNSLDKSKSSSEPETQYDDEERKAIQQESRPAEKKEKKGRNGNGGSQMILKRSVSPDRRIDSLSVEFALPLGKLTPEEIKRHAEATIHVQSEIVAGFLNGNTKTNQAPAKGVNSQDINPEGPVSAQMLDVGGMSTRHGWKFFINVQVNGRTIKLFGTRKELADYVAAAGFASVADHIEQGVRLNLPCRVITKPSNDGKYLNVERVFPIGPLQSDPRRPGK